MADLEKMSRNAVGVCEDVSVVCHAVWDELSGRYVLLDHCVLRLPDTVIVKNDPDKTLQEQFAEIAEDMARKINEAGEQLAEALKEEVEDND